MVVCEAAVLEVVVSEVALLEVAVCEVVVFESAMFKAPRALKMAEGVTGIDCAAMVEMRGRMQQTGGFL